MMIGDDLIGRVRFAPDPRRPYLARARTRLPGGVAFLKRYDLTAWSGTRAWRDRLGARCALIERITSGRTRFRTRGDRLLRVSVADEGMRPLPGPVPLSRNGFGELWDLLDRAHCAGLTHGDLTPRNVVTDGARADLIDWEPILVAPGPGPATDPVPERVTDPTRWLGGCDLLRLAPPDARVEQLDLIGINRFRRLA
jgi:hypothetical protein